MAANMVCFHMAGEREAGVETSLSGLGGPSPSLGSTGGSASEDSVVPKRVSQPRRGLVSLMLLLLSFSLGVDAPSLSFGGLIF